jgi:hypothetical protein
VTDDKKPTLGTAIDQVLGALIPFDDRERVTILETVRKHLAIELSPPSQRPSKPSDAPIESVSYAVRKAEAHSTVPQPEVAPFTDIRSLKTQKQPNSARQMACVVAYYLQELAHEGERKNTVSVADMEKYFKQANFKLPAKLEQVLVDGKRSGYFDSSTRGEYKLTRVGYNLVTHNMPSKGSDA